jgi:hypothetical protein
MIGSKMLQFGVRIIYLLPEYLNNQAIPRTASLIFSLRALFCLPWVPESIWHRGHRTHEGVPDTGRDGVIRPES